MFKIALFCLCFLSAFCFSDGKTDKTIEHKKALEKIENLVSNTQSQMRSNYNSQPPYSAPSEQYDQASQQEQPKDQTKQYPESSIGNNSSFKKAFYKTITILFGAIILVFVGIWLFRKFSGGKFQTGNNLRTIKVIEKRPISPKSILYLIEVGGQRILISESQFEVRRISELEWLDNTKQGL